MHSRSKKATNKKCNRVADRTFPDIIITWPQPGVCALRFLYTQTPRSVASLHGALRQATEDATGELALANTAESLLTGSDSPSLVRQAKEGLLSSFFNRGVWCRL